MPASTEQQQDRLLLTTLLEIYDPSALVARLRKAGISDWTKESLRRWQRDNLSVRQFTVAEIAALQSLLPLPPAHHPHYQFRFIDLFAGIGGIRSGFSAIGGQCVFTSEWNKQALRTYKANWFNDANTHSFNEDIRDITLSHQPEISQRAAYANIARQIPDHHVLLAGFPCQPFSLAGVSKKNSLGKAHGFECATQGTLFFDVARIIAVKQPAIFVLENVKNLRSHDKGRTFAIICQTLNELGYQIADEQLSGADDPKIIDGQHFLPQHRERIVLVGFRRDLNLAAGFTLRDIQQYYPKYRPTFKQMLDSQTEDKYILSVKLWAYLQDYARKHQAKGNGFGFGLITPDDPLAVSRTLSARYYKDGSEILLDRGWNKATGEMNFYDAENLARRPRRLTPRECARLMGFEQPGECHFRIPVSDTQAYRQFGNSVIVPVFAALAKLLQPYIQQAAGK